MLEVVTVKLVHLAPESRAKRIGEHGVRGARWTVDVAGTRTRIDRAVFAMPVLPDFNVTFQWLRELRRHHGRERMVAVYFRVPSTAEVLVGRYNEAHARVSASEAARRVRERPWGMQLVVTAGVPARDISAIKNLSTQLVGWTTTPPDAPRWTCVCDYCVPRGTPGLTKLLEARVREGLQLARSAKSSRGVTEALLNLDLALGRIGRELSAKGVLPFARHADSAVRLQATRLLGSFRRAEVEEALMALLDDDNSDVRTAAVWALKSAAGVKAAALALRGKEPRLLELLRAELDEED